MKKSKYFWVFAVFLFISCSTFAESLDEAIKSAKTLFSSGKYAEAVQAYKKILIGYKDELRQDKDKAAQMWQNFGEALLRNGQKSEAQKAFSRVGAHQIREDIDSEAIPETPSVVTPVVSATSNQVAELPNCKNQEVKDLFTNAFGHIEAGGQKIIAIRTLLDACKKEPNHPVLLFKTAELILEHGHSFLVEARKFMEKVKALKKNNLTSDEQIVLAMSYYLVAPFQAKEAEKILKPLLEKEPNNLRAKVAFGENCLQASRFQDALKAFQEAEKKDSSNLKAIWGIGYAYHGLKKSTQAMAAFRKAYSKESQDPLNNVRMGKAMRKIGEKRLTPRYFQSALRLDPSCYEAHLEMIPIHIASGRDLTVQKSLQIALAIDPDNLSLYFYRGILFEMYQKIPAAIENYLYAGQSGKLAAEAKLRLARIYMGVGHKFPGKGFSNENWVVKKMYERFYNPIEALNLLQEVITLEPNHPEAQLINSSILDLEDKNNRLRRVENEN